MEAQLKGFAQNSGEQGFFVAGAVSPPGCALSVAAGRFNNGGGELPVPAGRAASLRRDPCSAAAERGEPRRCHSESVEVLFLPVSHIWARLRGVSGPGAQQPRGCREGNRSATPTGHIWAFQMWCGRVYVLCLPYVQPVIKLI